MYIKEPLVEKYQFKCIENNPIHEKQKSMPSKEYITLDPSGFNTKPKRKFFFLPSHAHVSLLSSNYKSLLLLVALLWSFDSLGPQAS